MNVGRFEADFAADRLGQRFQGSLMFHEHGFDPRKPLGVGPIRFGNLSLELGKPGAECSLGLNHGCLGLSQSCLTLEPILQRLLRVNVAPCQPAYSEPLMAQLT